MQRRGGGRGGVWGGPGGGRGGGVGTFIRPERVTVFVWRSKERAPKPGRIGNLDKSCSGLEKSCSDMEKSGKMLDKNIQSSPSAAGLPLQLELELVGDSSDSLTDSNKAINI